MVQAVAEKLGEKYNILPVAFSQNEDGDLKKLKAFLNQPGITISAVISLMPFRLGAGPMGGDADQAVEILKEPFLPDQGFRGRMADGRRSKSRRWMGDFLDFWLCRKRKTVKNIWPLCSIIIHRERAMCSEGLFWIRLHRRRSC